jgi:hypothetical protein
VSAALDVSSLASPANERSITGGTSSAAEAAAAAPGGAEGEYEEAQKPLAQELVEALEAQKALEAQTVALEAQLEAATLRNTLAAAVADQQRLEGRLAQLLDNRGALLGATFCFGATFLHDASLGTGANAGLDIAAATIPGADVPQPSQSLAVSRSVRQSGRYKPEPYFQPDRPGLPGSFKCP